MVWAWMSGKRMLLEHKRDDALGMDALVSEHEHYCGLGMDALVSVSYWNTNIFMVWACMPWGPYAFGIGM